MTALNWKTCNDRHYEAFASCDVGGKYIIERREGYFDEQADTWCEGCCFEVKYQTKPSARFDILAPSSSVRTLAGAKVLAEFHHNQRAQHGNESDVTIANARCGRPIFATRCRSARSRPAQSGRIARRKNWRARSSA